MVGQVSSNILGIGGHQSPTIFSPPSAPSARDRLMHLIDMVIHHTRMEATPPHCIDCSRFARKPRTGLRADSSLPASRQPLLQMRKESPGVLYAQKRLDQASSSPPTASTDERTLPRCGKQTTWRPVMHLPNTSSSIAGPFETSVDMC